MFCKNISLYIAPALVSQKFFQLYFDDSPSMFSDSAYFEMNNEMTLEEPSLLTMPNFVDTHLQMFNSLSCWYNALIKINQFVVVYL